MGKTRNLQSNESLPPFACSFTPNVPELLMQLNCTIALSTYQAGKVIFLSAREPEKLIQLPRSFRKAMGIGLEGDKMVLATLDEVIVLANAPQLAYHYPKQPATYDALYVPRAAYYTGQIDIHDIDYGEGTIFAVNTSFSCLIKIDDQYSFTPVWQPPFITELASEDRCHLNGMILQDGKPRYVTAFNAGNTFQSWREEVTTGGILMDVESNEFIARGLPMPHSPRLIDGDIYLLLSATGQLVRLDKESGRYEVVNQIDGFVRGLARHGDYLFVGLSRLRKSSSTFSKLKIADKAQQAGVAIFHLPTGALVGQIQYHNSVEEIYDVQILPGMVRPGILNTLTPTFKEGLSIPGKTYWAKPDEETS